MSEILRGIVDKARASIKDGTDLILVVAGAASSAALAEVIRSWLPEQTATLADEAIAAAAGFLLFYFGEKIHPKLVPFGFGAFIAGIGAFTSEWVSSIILMLKKKA